MSSDADPVTSTADDAKARREARKARILNKGSDRLAKLTKQARGDDAEMLYPSSGSTSKATTTADQLKGDAPLDVNAMDDTADPPEIDISQQAAMDADLNRAMEMFAQQRQAQGQGQEQSQAQSQAQDPLQQMMAAMMGGSSAGNGPANGMPDLSQLFAAMQGNADQQQGGPQDPSSAAGNPFAPQPRGKTLSDRLFSFVHVALFVLVGYIFFSSTFSGSVTEPQTNPLITQDEDLYHSMIEKSQQLEYSDRIHKWASLAYYRPSVLDSKYYNVDAQWIGLGSDVPILYLILTLTLTLQILRLTLLRSAPPPSSLLFTLASQLPFPTLQWALKLGAKYVNILTTLLDDVALLIFALGGAIIYSVVVSGTSGNIGDADAVRAQSAAEVLGSSGGAMGHPEL